jgi:hypothetical protein
MIGLTAMRRKQRTVFKVLALFGEHVESERGRSGVDILDGGIDVLDRH